jgi:predicted DNA-binding transcriptional regulator AlpA
MDTAPSPDDLLLIHEVATITRRSVDTLRWLRHKGEGPKGHRAGRRVYFRRGDVAEWLAQQERQGADPRPAA